MPLTREEVRHVAKLARLSLNEEEVDPFTRQLNDILVYVEKLQEVDTSGVPAMAHVVPVFNVFREDDVTASLPRDEGLANAPAREEGTFVVPRII
jgi:aspartyl-tRNA(Asn)/glutamyl-tRNA(Gln) amidotransferase subunit C